LSTLGVEVVVCRSDGEFLEHSDSLHDFALIFLDPWTHVGKGAVIAPCCERMCQ
jgi:hypothetical protein